MRYAYQDLGAQPKGNKLTVNWRGSAADVLLLDPVNFTKYRKRLGPVMYSAGGYFRQSPAELTIPADGRWYVVADLRGYSTFADPTVEVRDPELGAETGRQQLTEVT